MEVNMSFDSWGILLIGLVFGYLLFYTVRHTPNLSLDSLATATGAVGGATIVALFGKYPHWVGPYGVGLFLGFLLYYIPAVVTAFYWPNQTPFFQKIGSPPPR
jgi:hypothetical protein